MPLHTLHKEMLGVFLYSSKTYRYDDLLNLVSIMPSKVVIRYSRLNASFWPITVAGITHSANRVGMD